MLDALGPMLQNIFCSNIAVGIGSRNVAQIVWQLCNKLLRLFCLMPFFLIYGDSREGDLSSQVIDQQNNIIPSTFPSMGGRKTSCMACQQKAISFLSWMKKNARHSRLLLHAARLGKSRHSIRADHTAAVPVELRKQRHLPQEQILLNYFWP